MTQTSGNASPVWGIPGAGAAVPEDAPPAPPEGVPEEEDVSAEELLVPPEGAEEEEPPLNLRSGLTTLREGSAAFVRETVRNGQRVAFDGDIVVCGDVNFGAELVATGNIAVMGALRGKAHAGYAGDERAVIAALSLQPTLLAIAKVVNLPPEEGLEKAGYPEKARLLAGKIVIEPLTD